MFQSILFYLPSKVGDGFAAKSGIFIANNRASLRDFRIFKPKNIPKVIQMIKDRMKITSNNISATNSPLERVSGIELTGLSGGPPLALGLGVGGLTKYCPGSSMKLRPFSLMNTLTLSDEVASRATCGQRTDEELIQTAEIGLFPNLQTRLPLSKNPDPLM